MFLPSKLVAFTTASLGTIGLSSYLIPYSLKNWIPSLRNIFSISKSSYDKQNINEFAIEQQAILKVLNTLFKDLSEGVIATKERKEERAKNIKEALDLILKLEGKINSFYEESLKIVESLDKLREQLILQQKERLEKESNLKTIEYWRKLFSNFSDGLLSIKESLNNFIEVLTIVPKNSNSKQKNSSGGAKLVKRLKKS